MATSSRLQIVVAPPREVVAMNAEQILAELVTRLLLGFAKQST
jgi:hypothetical protein